MAILSFLLRTSLLIVVFGAALVAVIAGAVVELGALTMSPPPLHNPSSARRFGNRRVRSSSPLDTRYKLGSHLESPRTYYDHHGIYVGRNRVVHFAPVQKNGGIDLSSDNNIIHEGDIAVFEKDGEVREVAYDSDNIYPPMKIVARARSKIGERGYDLFRNNCEHFCRWCMVAKAESFQVNFWKKAGSTVVGSVGGTVVEGILLGRFFGPGGLTVGGLAGFVAGIWSFASRKKLLPVYEEFVFYATALYFSTERSHPLGRNFRHGSQVDGKATMPLDASDKIRLFQYSGSWLFGNRNDWFITEKGLAYPKVDLYINFHDVVSITYAFRSIRIATADGITHKIPAKFVNSKSLAKFLTANISATPLRKTDFKVSVASILRHMFHLTLGALLLTAVVGYFLPTWIPYLGMLMIAIVLLSPLPFMDTNDNYKKIYGDVSD